MQAIVTTTINPPTEALIKFSKMQDWHLYVVGDLKTPKMKYEAIPNISYLSPDYQNDKYNQLSEMIGWNCIQRRNIGFIEAYKDGATVIASVDDDNIPYDTWGRDLLIGQEIEIDCYSNNETYIFDPLSVTNIRHLWHRGYPLQFINSRHKNTYIGKVKTKIWVQADLWDGDPDVDAISRIIEGSNFKITGEFPYTTNSLTIFNSQNTFIARWLLPYYCVLPYADRMDDIWGSIILQRYIQSPFIAFNKPSVYQKRNYHNIIDDLRREMMGHLNTINVIQNWEKSIDEKSLSFFHEYQKYFKD